MLLPRFFAVGLWVGVTAAATGTVWAATSLVAADVTDRPAPVVAQRDVVNALGPPAAPPESVTTTTTRVGGPTTTAGGSARPAPSTSVPVAPAQPVVTTTTPAPPVTTSTTRPAASATTVAPALPTGTYSTAGGVVRVSCNGLLISLVSAIPTNGFATNVVAAGPGNVDVHFVRPGQDLSVKAVCFGQPIRYDGAFPTR
ncbi:MAG TPA: hypothetical protein VHT97_00535 [Acidimicrobiales bacterium]|nr:hypothetical protein [Acidimicrobiales bacterium]